MHRFPGLDKSSQPAITETKGTHKQASLVKAEVEKSSSIFGRPRVKGRGRAHWCCNKEYTE